LSSWQKKSDYSVIQYYGSTDKQFSQFFTCIFTNCILLVHFIIYTYTLYLYSWYLAYIYIYIYYITWWNHWLSLSYSYDKYRKKPKITLYHQTCQTEICCRRFTIRIMNLPMMSTLKFKTATAKTITIHVFR